MKTPSIILFSIFSMFVLGQNYRGTIGKNEIVLHLMRSGENISGYYFYQNFGIDIPLSGKIAGSEIILNEYINGKANAEFRLKPRSNKGYTGNWTIPGIKESLPINLKPTEKSIPQIPKTVLGDYENDEMKSCPIRLTISKKNNNFLYHIKNGALDKNGKVVFYRDLDEQSVYIIFKGIKWSENEDALNDEGEPKYETGVPTDIEGLLYDGQINIQNAGNAMNYYVKFGNCDAKYIHLTKKK